MNSPVAASGVTRRIGLQRLFLLGSLLSLSQQKAWAGKQLEEPLVDSVRTALSSAISNSAPPIPEFQDTESRLNYLRWLGAMSERLKKKKPEWDVRREFLQTVWYESKRAGLDVSLVLGLIGVVLPGLPTTPFVLLAAACYAKASPRLHAALLNHRWTGPMLRDWESDRSLTRRSKTIAVGSMLLMVSFSIWSFRGRVIAQLVLLALGLIGAWVVLRIPTRKP